VKLADVYGRAPLPVQHLFATGYGVRELPRRHGGRFRSEVAALGARQWWSTEELVEDQSSRLRSMITWCAARVPHYRDLFSDLQLDPRDLRSPADLRALPLLDKETVRAHPERFLPDHPRPSLLAQSTGGTTGTPVRYWATRSAVQANYAVYEARTRVWANVRLGDRMASLHGQPIVPASQRGGPYWRRNLAFNQLYFSVYHLNSSTLPEYVEALERFEPEVIAGYTSAVHRIARHIVERGDVGRVNPRAVLVSSETLTSAARADMEAAFGCRVTNSYSLGELVAYISECDHGEMHVSTEYGVVELEETSVGHEIVASTLINRGMPLLRYRTGDLVIAAPEDSASCGRGLPLVAEVIGRVDDVVRTPEGATVGPAPMSLAFQRVPKLRRAQVHQKSTEEITVLMEVAEGFGPADAAFLEQELRLRLGSTIGLRLETIDAVPRTSGGKERLVVSTIGDDR
jgi:phenylacetate-CoA ligase